ncbi:DUF3288 family protein [Microcoleus sp. FACHB-831]|uniref:DUF3288 family protein n=1 Tax=Microcoleus sp. FACHB-831 TaxID=2692827 RepID=UPI00168948DC|nr:DUF3288 family protein [Microcoleus sp. FACHB-831]MBD1923558.1 DUF3288 family protein [Microcoleus sp. FACHB-831]
MSPSEHKDQQHPQEKSDRATVNNLLLAEPTNFNLAELARLKVRYRGFPGARDIQTDLDKVLQRWKLTEEELYVKTRQLHAERLAYKPKGNRQDEEDWS